MTSQRKLFSKIAIGNWGEDVACKYLLEAGYEVIERNFRTPYGEIDIIATLNGQLTFIEVKTRTNNLYGTPESSITAQKRNHMINAAQSFLQTHMQFDQNWQIDVISIESNSSQNPIITHFQNAIS